MGNIFSILCKKKNTANKENRLNAPGYKTFTIGDKTYILFENDELGEWFEI